MLGRPFANSIVEIGQPIPLVVPAPLSFIAELELFGITIVDFGFASNVNFASEPVAIVKIITFTAIRDPKFGSFVAVKGFEGLAASIEAYFTVQQELGESKATVVAGIQEEVVVGVGARGAVVRFDFTGQLQGLQQQEGRFTTLPGAFPVTT